MTPGGKLMTWDRLADLGRIAVPTLVIGAEHDTMDPRHLREMARRVQHGRYLHRPNGVTWRCTTTSGRTSPG